MQALHLQPLLQPTIVKHTWGTSKWAKLTQKNATMVHYKMKGILEWKQKKCGENDLRQGMKKPKVFLNALMKIGEQNHIMNEIKLELKAY